MWQSTSLVSIITLETRTTEAIWTADAFLAATKPTHFLTTKKHEKTRIFFVLFRVFSLLRSHLFIQFWEQIIGFPWRIFKQDETRRAGIATALNLT